VLAHLLKQHQRGVEWAPCYIASDDDPASEWDVYSWLAQRLGAPVPTAITGKAQNKRCSNARLKTSGYAFQFGDYRAGYADVIDRGARCQ